MLENNLPSSSEAAGTKRSTTSAPTRVRGLFVIGTVLITSALLFARYTDQHPLSRPKQHTPAPTSPTNAPEDRASDFTPLAASAADPGGSRTNPAPLAAPGSPSAPPDLAAAVAQARVQMQKDPNDLQVRIRLATLLDLQKQPAAAEDLLEEPLRHGQRLPEIFHALGMLYLHNNQWIGAADAFKIEVQLRPKDAQAHFKLATAYAYLSLPNEAAREFELTRKLDPQLPDVYMGLAYINNSAERYPYAVRYLNEFVARSKQPGPGYALLSRVYLNMREYDKAIEAGKKAVEALPTNPNVWYNLGQAYSYRPGAHSLADAVQALQHAVQLSPDWGHAHYELGYAYSRQNQIADAVAQYREAVRCEPAIGKYRYQLGRGLLQLHQTVEGQKEIAAAQPLLNLNQRENRLQDKLVTNPSNPQTLYELGKVNKQLGNYAQARFYFGAALQVAPHNTAARAELDALGSGADRPAH